MFVNLVKSCFYLQFPFILSISAHSKFNSAHPINNSLCLPLLHLCRVLPTNRDLPSTASRDSDNEKFHLRFPDNLASTTTTVQQRYASSLLHRKLAASPRHTELERWWSTREKCTQVVVISAMSEVPFRKEKKGKNTRSCRTSHGRSTAMFYGR